MKANRAPSEKHERGGSLVEYLLIVSLIVVFSMLMVRSLGTTLSAKYSSITSEIGKHTQ